MGDTIAPESPSSAIRLEKWVPGIRAVRTYDRAWLAKDLVAGIVLCALLVPQGMAYAELAGLPAITGLYTTIVCLFAYAALGPSPFLVLGPDSSLGPMIAAAILPLAASDEAYAIALAGDEYPFCSYGNTEFNSPYFIIGGWRKLRLPPFM